MLLHVEHDPVHPSSKADGRGRPASQLLDEVIIASATTKGGLRPFFTPGLELKYGSGIVIQTPHQAMAFFKGYPQKGEMPDNVFEVFFTFRAKMIDASRCGLSNIMAVGLLTVQKP